MRKLIVCNIMSLDGYYTGPGGNIMVMPMDEAFDAQPSPSLRLIDTRTWDGSGNVLVRYAARPAEPAR
jgi:hypothetical protein